MSDDSMATIISVLSTPPVSPAAGSVYLVGTSPTGDWSGKAGLIAVRVGTTWIFQPPRAGMVVRNGTGLAREYTGTAWVDTQANVVADIPSPRDATNQDLGDKINELLEALRAAGLLARTALTNPRGL